MWTLTLHPETGTVFSYLPGQFGFLRVKGAVLSEEHPFSISSEPSNKETLTITIKNLGDWTSTVQNIRVGDKATLDAPYGRFTPTLYDCKSGIVLIAGGVGITPMLSILRYFYQQDRNQKLTLFWGVNDRNDLICKYEFEAFQKEMENFAFIPVLMKDESFEGEKGFINQERLERFLEANSCDLQAQQYFLCGPPVMQTSILKILKSMGIKKKTIHYESFSL